MTEVTGGTGVAARAGVDEARTVARLSSRLLRAMSNERRFMILCHLLQGEKSVGELQALIGISQSALSQHLARLRAEDLVTTRREAQSIYYAVSNSAVADVVSALRTHFAGRIA
jgi:DNA-binding transcriptional ArsR family regulator